MSFEAPDRNGAFPWCSAEAEYTAVIGAAPREQLFRSVRLNTKRLRDRECTYLANFGASHGCSHNELSDSNDSDLNDDVRRGAWGAGAAGGRNVSPLRGPGRVGPSSRRACIALQVLFSDHAENVPPPLRL